MASPRDRFLTVYGRRPVLEALADERLTVDKILVADNARGPEIAEIERLARARRVDLRRASAYDVTRLSRNGRQDQGVAADVVAPAMRPLTTFIDEIRDQRAATVAVLDGVTNPQNVGMILRTAVAAGVDGVVVPTAGVADLGPLVVKASAGVAFSAPIVRARTAAEAIESLRAIGCRVYGLDARADRSLYDAPATEAKAAFVFGGEHDGLSVAVDETIAIPMADQVDSLNVAVAAGVVLFERRRTRP